MANCAIDLIIDSAKEDLLYSSDSYVELRVAILNEIPTCAFSSGTTLSGQSPFGSNGIGEGKETQLRRGRNIGIL
jgi:hypothetical protein